MGVLLTTPQIIAILAFVLGYFVGALHCLHMDYKTTVRYFMCEGRTEHASRELARRIILLGYDKEGNPRWKD